MRSHRGQPVMVSADVLRVWRSVKVALASCPDEELAHTVYTALIENDLLGRVCLKATAVGRVIFVSFWSQCELDLLTIRDALRERRLSVTDRRARIAEVLEAFQRGT